MTSHHPLPQPGILDAVPAASVHLTFALRPGADPGPALAALVAAWTPREVVGVGPSLALALGRDIPWLRPLPARAGPGVDVPATPAALWLWLRGDDLGLLVRRARELEALLGRAFARASRQVCFRFGAGLDLSGYRDGTENPEGDAAVRAAICAEAPCEGGSFAAVMPWRHDLAAVAAMGQSERDAVIGRREVDDVELSEAPLSAHVKRTAQEGFEDVGLPDAFVVRRSMPWADASGEGLVFLSFGRNFEAFLAQLRRMTGGDDGVVDALFRFSRPEGMAGFYCPPVLGARLAF
jgi:putative iron-dependent peroxidase